MMGRQNSRRMRALRLFGAALLGMIFLAAFLAGCSRREEEREPLARGQYYIYYLNSSMTRLVSRVYEAQETEGGALVEELMGQFLTVPEDLDCQPALSERVTYQGSRQEDQVLYLYFDLNYSSMSAAQEVLCRAALTCMMTQIEGVDYVSIYCGDQPLMDRQGNPVGAMAASDFIMNTSNVNAYEKAELTLYFADETGSFLVPERREVVHSINTSTAQLIVEQLIAGPSQEGNFATLPSDCKILSLSVTDNVCYINFDGAFLNTTLPVSEYIPIYSIVNSLCETGNVTRVQIMVNGSQDVMFRNVVSLNTTFERNQEYIKQ